jgi:membrane protein DedA with SNARE-associated domain
MDNTVLDFILNLYGPMPYILIFGVLLVCGLGAPIPEDFILIVAGWVSYLGITNLWAMMIVSYFGVMLGDSIVFGLGSLYGKKLTRRWPFRLFLTEESLALVKKKIHKHGSKVIFAARFMPGLRAPLFFFSGTLHLPYRVFLFYDGLAALLSVPLIIGVVFRFGDVFDAVRREITKVEHGLSIVIALVILSVGAKWYLSHRKGTRKK